MKSIRSLWYIILAVFLLAAITVSAAAQAKKRTQPKPLATPPPNEAEVVSRANDYPDTSSIIVPVDKSAATDKKPSVTSTRLTELEARMKKVESEKNETYDEKQKRMLLNLDILTKAEARSEGLRKQMFDMVEKENSIKTRLDQIDYESRPEVIERTLQLAGSLRPEEVRDSKRKALLAEKANLTALLADVQSTRANLASTLQKSDELVEKLRDKLEKDINDALAKDDKPDLDN
ncbi:MAG: hypothetical protein JO053_04455 [Acidobacteria bacterium]|nr:hypothetical protein [Acidobacteriota bacterium]